MNHDALTGLPNRVVLRDRLGQALGRLRRRDGTVGVLFLDVDGFKQINDRYGHGAGDEFLREVPQRLRSALRADDTVARLGGDEFVILLEDCGGEVGALQVAERVLQAFEKPFTLGDETLALRVSMGIAVTETADESADQMLTNADVAMYRAKHAGGDGLAVFDTTLRARANERLGLARDLRAAIGTDQLSLHYQPIVDLGTKRVISVEALVRWDHPVRGQVAPDEFVRLAEETGIIVELGRWVLERACTEFAAALDEAGDRRIELAVNLSPRQLADLGLPALLRDVMARTGLGPRPRGAGDHRDRADPRIRLPRRPPVGAQAGGRADRARRLRLGLLLAGPPQALPDRRDQDRPLVRGRAGHPVPGRRHRGRDPAHGPRAGPRGRGRGRGVRDQAGPPVRAGLPARPGLPVRPPRPHGRDRAAGAPRRQHRRRPRHPPRAELAPVALQGRPGRRRRRGGRQDHPRRAGRRLRRPGRPGPGDRPRAALHRRRVGAGPHGRGRRAPGHRHRRALAGHGLRGHAGRHDREARPRGPGRRRGRAPRAGPAHDLGRPERGRVRRGLPGRRRARGLPAEGRGAAQPPGRLPDRHRARRRPGHRGRRAAADLAPPRPPRGGRGARGAHVRPAPLGRARGRERRRGGRHGASRARRPR